MNRNIITTITLSKGKVFINVLEKLTSNTIEIFNDESDVSRINNFIKSSLSHIEKLIGGKVSKVAFVLQNNKSVNGQISLAKESIKIIGNTVAKQDVHNLIKLIEQKNMNNNESITLVKPLKFDVHDIMTKSYSQAPIHKTGKTLSIVASVTRISKTVYEYIQQIAKASNVEINAILLEGQAVTHANLSKNALVDGSVHININNNQVDVMVNKNNAVVASLPLYNFGYKFLIKEVVKQLSCTETTAINLLAAHASLFEKSNRVIHMNQIGTNDKSFTVNHLTDIIKAYIHKLVAITKKFISQKKVEDLPIIISGQLNGISGLANYFIRLFESDKISVHSPLTFVEINKYNINGIGVANFIAAIDKLLGKQYDTIIHTNPNSIKKLRLRENRSWIERLKTKIGGKHDWK